MYLDIEAQTLIFVSMMLELPITNISYNGTSLTARK